jgi:polysaccharide export outer membrane protein
MGNAATSRRSVSDPRVGRLGVLLIMGWMLAGCGASARKDVDLNTLEAKDEARQQELSDLFGPYDDDWVYQVQAGDQLEVVFFTHPEQNRFVQVRPDGRITMPFIGDVEAAGKAPADLATEIQTAYESVLIKPRVDVIVQELSAPIYVLGEVNRPGEFPYTRRVDLVQAVAKAGGFNDEARLSNLVVLRRARDGTGAVAILDFRSYMDQPDGPGNIQLRPFDVVWVPKSTLTRWSDASESMFRGVLNAQDVVLKGWTLVKFDDVYSRGVRP